MSASPSADSCIPNIGTRGRRRRLLGGMAWLVVGLGVAGFFHVRGASVGVHAVLVVPFTLAALGWFQARERT